MPNDAVGSLKQLTDIVQQTDWPICGKILYRLALLKEDKSPFSMI